MFSVVGTDDEALALASSLLAPLERRWSHVQGVVDRCRVLRSLFDSHSYGLLVSAAYLHDIGYAPALDRTGFHPLDGAHYLRSLGYERLACLVAHHSEAHFEAELRGLSAVLEAFPREHSAVADALTYCDLLTGPDGTAMTLGERKADVLARYGASHVVAVAYRRALPYHALTIGRIHRRLAARTGRSASG